MTAVFAAVVGQPRAVAELAAAACRPVASHAWLLTGPPGSGRSVAAGAFAAALECTGSPPGCSACAGCRAVLAGTHPDVTVVAPEGLSLGVDAVRGLVAAATGPPLLGRRRVLVIEDADRLTEAGANVLLKPLEEPGGRTVFVLCAPSAEDLPPTVRSRCRLVALREPAAADVAALLVAEGVDPAMAAFAAAAAQGHVGRARRLATDEGARHRRAEVLRLPAQLSSVAAALAAASSVAAAAAEEATALESARAQAEVAATRAAFGVAPGARGPSARAAASAVRDLERAQKSRATRTQRDAVDRALVDLAALYRDVLLRQLGAPCAPAHPDQAAPVARLAAASTPEATLARIDAVLAARAAIAANVAPLLALEAMALALATR